MITVWLARPEGETAKASIGLAEELKKNHAKYSVIHVVEPGAGLPTPEGRDELVAGARRNVGTVVCVGVLLPEGSVLSSMLRVFIRGIRTLLRGEMTTVIELDVDALARQVVEHHARGSGVRLVPRELAAAINEARRRAIAVAA